PGLYWTRADGAGEAVRLTEGKANETPSSISSDGKLLAYTATGAGGSQDLFTAAIEGDAVHPKLGKPVLFLGTPAEELMPMFSPDGHWVAYQSMESGTPEIYVRPFPGPGGRWQISAGGGSYPAWSRGGRQLFFKGASERLMVADYTVKGDSFINEKPRVWQDTQMLAFGALPTWDLAPDGKRVAALLADVDETSKAPTHLIFLLHFFDELQRRK